MFNHTFKKADYKKLIRFFIFTSALVLTYPSVQADDLAGLTFKQKHVTPFIQKATDKTSGLILLSGVLAVGATHEHDVQVRSEWNGYQKMDKNTAHIGDLLGTGAFSLVAAGLEYQFDDRDYVYQAHLRGFVYGGISIYSLKTAFSRPRPGNSSNRQSFPSGHTTIMFMSATHLQHAYGWGVGSVAYALSVLSGASRLTDDVHWFSDTVAGAFLGIWVGRATFYNPSDLATTAGSVASLTRKDQIAIFPIVAHENVGVYVDYRF